MMLQSRGDWVLRIAGYNQKWTYECEIVVYSMWSLFEQIGKIEELLQGIDWFGNWDAS